MEKNEDMTFCLKHDPYICTQITLSKSIPSYIDMECSFSNQRNKKEENAEEIDM